MHCKKTNPEARVNLLDCWCGNKNWLACLRRRRFGILRCPACACYRTDPPPLQSDEDSEGFYSNYYKVVGTGVKAIASPESSLSSPFWKVAERFPALRTAKKLAVDIGCGDGHLCAELKAQGWGEVVGLDVSRTRIERARRLYPYLSFSCSTISKLGLEQESIDLVIMDAVIEHLPSPLDFLKKTREYLVHGGKIVLTTPNMDSGHFRLIGRFWSGSLAPHAHIYLFTPSSLSTLLKMAGYVVEGIGSYHTPFYSLFQLSHRFLQGDIKGAVWASLQNLGAYYGRLIASGPLLFAVANKR